MKIVTLIAENIKRLQAVEIKPDGNLVEITGRNGQGKTSVLDSIWWALASASHIQAAPIRKGANEARIRLDLGEIVVTRTFKRGESGEQPTSLVVENAEGARFPSPQRMLDSLLGALSFDPLEFARMEAREQFDALRRFVPGVDFEEVARANAIDFARRTEVNSRAKEARASANGIQVEAGLAPVDISELVAEIQDAERHNAEAARMDRVRAKDLRDADDFYDRAAALLRTADDLRSQADRAEREAAAAMGSHRETKAAAQSIVIPAPIDVSALAERIKKAEEINAKVSAAAAREGYVRSAAQLEATSADLTKLMADREEKKRAAIAAAQMPVPGIEFGDGAILFDGVPFDQASDAEKLRASIAIAMAANPKLRVLRVRDGSLLDSASMALLAEMAAKHDYQVWIERVNDSGNVGFVIEDGRLAARMAA